MKRDDIEDYRGNVLGIFRFPAYKTKTKKDLESKLVSVATDNLIKIWDTNNSKCDLTISGHTSWVRHMAMLPDGRIVSASDDKTLKIWNIDTHNEKLKSCDLTLTGHTYYIFGVVVLSDGRIVSCSHDHTIKIWI